MTSFLQAAGSFIKKALHIGGGIALAAQPIVTFADPLIAPLYDSALGVFMAAEAAFPAVSGNGPQKLALSTQTLVPIAQAFAQQNHLVWPQEAITAWADAVVKTVNMIPAPTPATPTA